MKIIVENSTWNNVGDGWYQFSLYFMLKECLPQHEVILGEGPIKRAFRITSSKQMKNALNWMDYQVQDYPNLELQKLVIFSKNIHHYFFLHVMKKVLITLAHISKIPIMGYAQPFL